MSKLTKDLTRTLFQLAYKDLEEAKLETRSTRRVGMVLQAMKKAVQQAHIYTWNGVPHVFTGKIYEPCDEREFNGVVFDVLDKNYANLPPEDLTSIFKIQKVCLQIIQSKPLNIRHDIIVFENCVLLLGELTEQVSTLPANMTDKEKKKVEKQTTAADGTSTLEPKRKQYVKRMHHPKYAQTTMCHFDYDPTAICNRWVSFLDTVLPNKQTQMVLQEFLGCVFIDRQQVKLENMCMLVGTGSNGKSVVADTVRGIVGNESMTTFGLDSILVGGESLHNLAKMNGKRMNYCTEIQAINAGRFADRLKTIISGEPVECRQMYGEPFTAYDLPLLMANCNTLPLIEDNSYGMQRRFIIIRFGVTIEPAKQDKQLSQKLIKEYAGIFNWIMEGRQRFIDQHFRFTRSKAIERAVQEYATAENNIHEWLNVRQYSNAPTDILQDTPLVLSSKTMYDDYRRWCIYAKAAVFSHTSFMKELVRSGFHRKRSNDGYKFDLYGDGAYAVVCRRHKETLAKTLAENGKMLDGQELYLGNIVDVGDDSAARHCHISRPYLKLLQGRGYLAGTYTVQTRTFIPEGKRKYVTRTLRIYDHRRLLARLEAYGVFDEEGLPLTQRRADDIRRAKAFNEEMRRMQQPFRKLMGKGVAASKFAGKVIVDPDWEYTPEAADALTELVARAKVKEAEINDAIVEADGTITTKTITQAHRHIVANAVEKELTAVNANDLYAATVSAIDTDTGEAIEVDIEDADLIIE